MQTIYADSKKLVGPLTMNGKVSDARFTVHFKPGEETQLSDKQYKFLKDDDSFKHLIDEGILKAMAETTKSALEIAEDAVEAAESTLESATTNEEKKAASAALKEAKEALKKAQKKAEK